MAATRTSSRQAALKAKEAIAAAPDVKSRASTKRKNTSEKGPERKKEKKVDQQPTEEEVMKEAPKREEEENQPNEEREDNEEKQEIEEKQPDKEVREGPGTSDEEKEAPTKEEDKSEGLPQESAPVQTPEPVVKEKEEEQSEAAPGITDEKPAAYEEPTKEMSESSGAQHSTAQKTEEREPAIPSKILEKGIIYFFFRPRVNIADPQGMSDVARSFFVLRPTSMGTVFNEQGPMDADAKCRLLMLPKKKYPTTARERDMAFVDQAGVSLKQLQESFLPGETYETKTQGEQHSPAAKPYAEGVYAITRTQRASHLAYLLTIPEQLGPVQEDFGLSARGSFIVQSKNPKHPGPSFAQLPKDPEYPESIREKFGDYRWIPLEPEFLDYPNAQFLMIGGAHQDLGKAAVGDAGDKRPEEHQPGEELEKLEQENEERVDNLRGDDAVYEDLGYHAKQHPQVPTTWA
ncbi:hypothetical protein FE257_000540 [Aspergillus nanangensis]|uniref:BTB domain transcription factor n=1 Tax=Aspergillus nanangensis TaxID=2582783 RepID=A0AAD4GYT1_ASPNN|nr:hypothetical protein FE257_000540 [Aspergillus nanangensis]